MKALLDTHAFIWWDSNPTKLSPAARACIQDPANTVALSVVSIWEMLIKSDLGKLALTRPLRETLAQQQSNGILILPVFAEHVLALERLPRPHKDPFDRLLAAQSVVEEMVLITADTMFSRYPMTVLW